MKVGSPVFSRWLLVGSEATVGGVSRSISEAVRKSVANGYLGRKESNMSFSMKGIGWWRRRLSGNMRSFRGQLHFFQDRSGNKRI